MQNRMVQYGLWPNCCNNCDFCLRMNREIYSKEKQIFWIRKIRSNLDYIDWKDSFSAGISLLGGEIFYITDKDIQQEFHLLVDDVIKKILKVSKNPVCKFSTVTNGLYDPAFLYSVIDKIKNEVGMQKVDINFSYDLKYRYKSQKDAQLVLKNINEFHRRYNYKVGVQMILTQYVINMWKDNTFNVNKFIDECIPGNSLCFLYPHPIHTGKKLDDFNFKRSDFIEFLVDLKKQNDMVYRSFVMSTKNSGTFKYTGFRDKLSDAENEKQQPILSDGKEIINSKCGHSMLYTCYSDSDDCMLCDLKHIEPELI